MGSRKSRRRQASGRQPVQLRASSDSPVASPSTSQEQSGKPLPGSAEPVEDIAVFSAKAREKLAVAGRDESLMVGRALELMEHGDYESALAAVSSIPRSSLYSDWRLFLRGLASFYQEKYDDARANWARLDPSRRPARIAKTLLQADDADREDVLPEVKVDVAQVQAAARRRGRPDLVESARKIVAARNNQRNEPFSGLQASMLKNLVNNYGKAHPEFVMGFARACVAVASQRAKSEAFMTLRHLIPGPAIDPKWRLQQLMSMIVQEEPAERIDAEFDAYCKVLEATANVEPVLKKAIQHLLLVMQAQRAQWWAEREVRTGNWSGDAEYWFERGITLLERAIEVYPTDADAHFNLLEEIREFCEYLDGRRHLKALRDTMLDYRWRVQRRLVDNFPVESGLTLELIDHYFDSDRLAEVRRLMDRLSEQRVDSPLAKAVPWKFKLRELFHRSRLKAALPRLEADLQNVKAMWPAWLPDHWWAFLMAALKLRLGKTNEFEALYAAAVSALRSGGGQAQAEDRVVADELNATKPASAEPVEEVMLFAALQHLHLPASQLKPFRQRVVERLARIKDLTDDQLLRLGSFLWDLQRSGLKYKAARIHVSKVGHEFCRRLRGRPSLLDHPLIRPSVYLASDHAFWSLAYRPPIWVTNLARKSADMSVGLLNVAVQRQRFYYVHLEYWSARMAGEALEAETDPFYKHHIKTTLAGFEELRKAHERKSFMPRFQRFEDAFEDFDDNDNDDDDDDDGEWYDHEADARFQFGKGLPGWDDADDSSVDQPDLGSAFSRVDNKHADGEVQLPSRTFSAPKTAEDKRTFDKQRRKELERRRKK